jgi:hypothetical protein
MPIDFGKLGGSTAADTIIAPRDLFNVLPAKAPRYQYPRDVQADVWHQWFARRNERDLTVKMNTGSGKTVVGLLMLKSSLNEGVGPAVYVAPTPYLVQQVIAEARDLGLELTDDARSARVSSGKAILVVNIHKLINGESVFGVGEEGVKIPIGSCVIDDAHACLAASEEQFSLTIDAALPAYGELLELFGSDLEQQSLPGAIEIKEQEPNKNMLVPYWAWAGKQAEVQRILRAIRNDKNTKYRFPLIKNHLELCECVFGGGEVEISLRCLPISMIPSFSSAQRRIFMSATVSDDSILVTHFDADPGSVKKPIYPESSGDIGDRMIFVPQELNPDLTDDEIKAYLKQCSQWANVVVIVPSEFRAKYWADVASDTLRASTLLAGVDKLRKGPVGIVVLVNKYDGIDLPDNACRILVIDGLPDVRGRLEKIEQGMLFGSDEVLREAIQRIEQGMGRGIRSNEDFCAVLLMGRSLTSHLYARNAKKFFSAATRAQLDLSEQLAKQLPNPSISQIHEAVRSFLGRDPSWVRASKAAVIGAKYTAGDVSQTALSQRQAFNAASSRDYRRAVAEMQKAVNAASNDRVKAWLMLQMAEYEQRVDPVQSQLILKEAVRLNSQITHPLDGIEYVRLPSQMAEQASLCLSYLRDTYSNPNSFVLDMNAHGEALVFKPDTAELFERTMAAVGRMIGFLTQQPERDYRRRGPDVLWSLGRQKFLVIECKNGATTDTIIKDYCNQLTGSMIWFGDKYGPTCHATPVMVHPASVIEYAATMHPEARIITGPNLDALRTAFREFAKALAGKPRFGTETEVAQLLAHYKLTAEMFVSHYTVKPRAKS